jgi:hypothetical protein
MNHHYWNHECIIDQGDVKLKNESIPSWRNYILDFLFYKRRKATRMHEVKRNHNDILREPSGPRDFQPVGRSLWDVAK